VGLLAQLAAIPLLVILVLACAVTIIGILAIPVAVLAWALAYTGAFTWAAATVGLGAVVKSRGGVLRLRFETTTETSIPSWQTPTPVQGVVAARRPVHTTPPSSPTSTDRP